MRGRFASPEGVFRDAASEAGSAQPLDPDDRLAVVGNPFGDTNSGADFGGWKRRKTKEKFSTIYYLKSTHGKFHSLIKMFRYDNRNSTDADDFN